MGHRCCTKQKIKRGLWSPEEDEKLLRYITTHGHKSWSSVPKFAGLQRCGKSCRLRWINYLRPDLKRGSFTLEEEQIIIDIHRILGNRWAQIAKHLPGRTDNEVKNFWNSCIKKKLISQGLDPQTHTLLSSHRRITTSSSSNFSNNNNDSFLIITSNMPNSANNNAPIIETSQGLSSSSSLPTNNQAQPSVVQAPSSIVTSSDFCYEPSRIIENNNSNNSNVSNIICSHNYSRMNNSIPSKNSLLWNSRTDHDAEDFRVQTLEEGQGMQHSLHAADDDDDDEIREANNIIEMNTNASLEGSNNDNNNNNNFDFGLLESVLNSEFMSHDINYMDELAWNF
ncbi:hypothetical protein HN51_025702 [Arachis hypogaea]|uniref:uncharacterized protein isoform X1 n=1 Tax=Arachis hypogaea TaxID=3818 RepID=UPI000DED10D4|nr:transcription factor MYB8 [Arachis hypogaea]QHO28188.1 Transcription factor [Arachis hypogaea]